MSDVIVTPKKNGPLYVRGKITVVTPGGRILPSENETWLCRCGHSAEKPFCDGTHKRLGFQSDLDAASAPAAEGYEDVCALDDVAEGEPKGITVAGAAVVLSRVEGKLYAVAGVCTHADARLADGDLDGFVLACPLHDSGFDVRTGKAVRPPATEPLARYDVRVEGGRVLVSRKPV